MRELLYMPVIHESADMGSAAFMLNRLKSLSASKGIWRRHQEVVKIFWDNISSYTHHLAPSRLDIFQDGLAAEGELGYKIIEEGALNGSRNHQIVLDLIKRGGKIRKTEDISLLKQEYDRILQLMGRLGDPTNENNGKIVEDGEILLNKRDRFISHTVNLTLTAGKIGLLFIGAFHHVRPYLDPDIRVKEIKRIEKVKAYYRCFLAGLETDEFQTLARYMTAPIPPDTPIPYKNMENATDNNNRGKE